MNSSKSRFERLAFPTCTICLLSLSGAPALAQTVTYDYDLRGRLIQVTNPNASTTSYEFDNTGNLIAVKNPPLISSISSPQANSGLRITLTGVNFIGATAVLFGTTSTTNFTVISDTQISVVVPYTTTSGPISVVTASGTVASTTNFSIILTVPTAVSTDPNAVLSSTAVTAPQFAVNPSALQYFSTGATFPQVVYRSLFDYYGVAIPAIASQPGSTGLQPTSPAGSPRLNTVQYNYFASNSDNGRAVFLGTAAFSASATFTTSTTGSVVLNSSANTAVTPFGSSSLTFSASDTPLSTTEISSYTTNQFPTRGNPIQVPTVFGAIAAAYNQNGAPSSSLNLSTADLCHIYDGTITNYNQLTAPSTTTTSSLPISVIVRSDSSGTTRALTSYLAAACPTALGSSYYITGGVNTFPNVPQTANFIRANSETAVSNKIGTTIGAFGYLGNSLVSPYQVKTPDGLQPAPLAANLQNPVSGSFIFPTPTTINRNLAGISLSANATYPCILSIAGLPVVPSVGNAYPITVPTYILAYSRYPNSSQTTAVRGISNFILSNRSTPTPQANDQITQGLGFSVLNNNSASPFTATNQLRASVRACINTITSP